MKASSRVCGSAPSETGTLGPYCPEDPHQLLDGLHPGKQIGAGLRIEPFILTGGPGQVPGVHEHIGRIELVDRAWQRKLADHRMPEGGRRLRPVEQSLHRVTVDLPGGDGVLLG